MIRAQDLEQQIRGAVDGACEALVVFDTLDDDAVESRHQLLVDCVNAVNARLKKCDALLRKGLRDEALQECHSPPNLMQCFRDLDFDRWSEWAERVAARGFTPQPELLSGVYEDLDAAHGDRERLEPLLRRHRLLALARAPLKARLANLRAIAQRDPNPAFWSEDIAAYEAARVRQIESEVNQRFATMDLATLAALTHEVTSGDWRTPPPKALVERLNGAHRTIVVTEARRQLQTLAPQIDSAYNELNEESLRGLRDRWQRQAEIASLDPRDDLAVETSHAFAWLEDRDAERRRQAEFARSLGDLESALDREDVSLAELERLAVAVERFGEAIPKALEQRYLNRVHAIQLASRRRSAFILTTSLMALALVGAAIAAAGLWTYRAREVADFREILQADLESGAYGQGVKRFEEASRERPYLAEDPGARQLHDSLTARLKEEEARAKRFEEYLAKVDSHLDAGGWDDVDSAQRTLVEAEKVALGDEEGALVARSRTKIASAYGSLRDQVNEEFASKGEPLRSLLGSIDQATPAQIDEALILIENLSDMPRVSPEIRAAAQLDVSERRLRDRLDRIEEERRLAAAFDRAMTAVGEPLGYGSGLRAYLQLASEGPRTADFKKALQNDLPALSKVEAWNLAARGWNVVRFDAASGPGDALERASKLVEAYPGYPAVDEVRERTVYLRSIAARTAAQTTRDSLLESPLLKQVGCVKLRSGAVFYCPRQGAIESQGQTFRYYVNPNDLATTKSQFVSPEARPEGGLVVTPAPQVVFAENALALIRQRRWGYEAECCLILQNLVDDVTIDPIFKTQLLSALIERMSSGSSVLQQRLAPLSSQLSAKVQEVSRAADNTAFSDLNWFDSTDKNVLRSRTSLESTLGSLGELRPASIYKAGVETDVKRLLTTPRLPTFEWVGILLRDGDQWACRIATRAGDRERGEVFLFAPRPQGDPFLPIGQIEGSEWKLRPDPEAFFEGRLVYVRSDS